MCGCALGAVGDADIGAVGDADIGAVGDADKGAVGDADIGAVGDADIGAVGDADIGAVKATVAKQGAMNGPVRTRRPTKEPSAGEPPWHSRMQCLGHNYKRHRYVAVAWQDAMPWCWHVYRLVYKHAGRHTLGIQHVGRLSSRWF